MLVGPLIAQSGKGDAKLEYGKSVERELVERHSLSYQTRDASFKAFIDDRRTLHIEGTVAAETIIAEVISDSASITIQYRTDGSREPQKSSFRLGVFDRLVLNARGGADFVNIIDATEQLSAQKKVQSG